MGDFFGTFKRRADANAQRVVEACIDEIADFQAIESKARGSMLEFAVVVRRRTADLVAADEPLLESDLAFIESVGEERGTQGVSPAGQRGALSLHAGLTLREISEAAGPGDLNETMRMLDWLARHGVTAQAAYTRGYFRGHELYLSVTARVRLLTTMVLHDDPMAAELGHSLGMPVAEHYLVTVIRIAGERRRVSKAYSEQIVQPLLEQHRVPLALFEPDELVALIPCRGPGLVDTAAAESLGLSLARLFAEVAGGPCSVGTAHGRRSSLGQAAELARKVSRVAPIERVPQRLYTVADVFAELGAVETPQMDEWLRKVARRLSDGPDLVVTLDAYYRNDMNRPLTSTSLHIHPRTLDYRLRRVRDLVGIDPGSTRGVRVLSTAVTRALAGAWDHDR
ncbi:helix-turn-helix domain-containing protein [Sphaerisporangium flaviroseum]|uniref:Helix-turn-helix domain-containing protein n=1 Tax=Sphaerisporangium flaviroseum TaxID=509199 RepID=A0ABP7JD39_9ACTN